VIGVVLLLFGRGKISELMGDVAQGIKAFKKGMSDDDSAKSDAPKIEPGKTEPVKTLDHQTADSSAAGAKSQAS
jgi:sec-independent protein translocase protein TatA